METKIDKAWEHLKWGIGDVFYSTCYCRSSSLTRRSMHTGRSADRQKHITSVVPYRETERLQQFLAIFWK